MLLTVQVHFGESLQFDPPRPLFRSDFSALPEGLSSPIIGASADSQRFLVVTKVEENATTPVQVVLNWPQMLQSR